MARLLAESMATGRRTIPPAYDVDRGAAQDPELRRET
jgi:hypothetical protein